MFLEKSIGAEDLAGQRSLTVRIYNYNLIDQTEVSFPALSAVFSFLAHFYCEIIH